MERDPLPNAMNVLVQLACGCVKISPEAKLWANVLGLKRAAPKNLYPEKLVIIRRRESIDLLDCTKEIRTNIYSFEYGPLFYDS